MSEQPSGFGCIILALSDRQVERRGRGGERAGITPTDNWRTFVLPFSRSLLHSGKSDAASRGIIEKTGVGEIALRDPSRASRLRPLKSLIALRGADWGAWGELHLKLKTTVVANLQHSRNHQLATLISPSNNIYAPRHRASNRSTENKSGCSKNSLNTNRAIFIASGRIEAR